MNKLTSVRALQLWELETPRHSLAWLSRIVAGLLCGLSLMAPAVLHAESHRKLDPELNRRADLRRGTSRVVVRLSPGATLPDRLRPYVRGNRLGLIDGYVLNVPDTMLTDIDGTPEIASAHQDRDAWAADYLSTKATAADIAQRTYDLTGRGVGIAVIDSGITSWHDDLTPDGSRGRWLPYGSQRVTKFVDFVNDQVMPYDDPGHGSHVAGIILGNGYDSNGRQVGMAPDAELISLKVLDQNGRGSISTIIEALEWVADNADTYNIRVVNLSLGAAVTQSYWVDPLALAARRLTERGIVVVAAAGNLGKNAAGALQHGGIIAPGNAPWVLTVGASSTEGTARKADDIVAPFSSIGPTRGDYLAKPDIVAPGKGIISLASPGSTLYQNHPDYLTYGSRRTGYPPYLSLSGTSMAAPQVTGAVALMLQANPKLTPNLVKAILQYTARQNPAYSPLQEGAGFLDVLGAVRLARFYAANKPGTRMPVDSTWSQHIIWGNHELSGGYNNPLANAWATNIVWGVSTSENIVWGVQHDLENIVWGTLCGDESCSNIVWGVNDVSGSNIVWGVDSTKVWGTTTADNIVWGVSSAENIVWGVSGGQSDNIVWGVACGYDNCANIVWGVQTADNIVWGVVGDVENIVWGVADNIVWGVLDGSGNIVWGVQVADNIVWGVSVDNIVWGVAQADNVVWAAENGRRR